MKSNNLIYRIQFGFEQSYSTSHGLNRLMEDVRKNMNEHKVRCGIFRDHQKALDTVDHNISLAKLKHDEQRGVAIINGFKSYHIMLKYGISTRPLTWTNSILNIYINALICPINTVKAISQMIKNSYNISVQFKKLNRLVIFS